MKHFLIPVLLFLAYRTQGQINKDYTVVVDGDTLTILLTNQELSESKEERVAELQRWGKKKKKRLPEKISWNIKLKNNDTIFWAFVVDYYDEYLVALTGSIKQKSKKVSEIVPIGFRRIPFSEMERIESRVSRRLMPPLLLGTVVMCAGISLTIYSLFEAEGGDPVSPIFAPAGLGIIYLGGRIWGNAITQTYYLNEWSMETRSAKRKPR